MFNITSTDDWSQKWSLETGILRKITPENRTEARRVDEVGFTSGYSKKNNNKIHMLTLLIEKIGTAMWFDICSL